MCMYVCTYVRIGMSCLVLSCLVLYCNVMKCYGMVWYGMVCSWWCSTVKP